MVDWDTPEIPQTGRSRRRYRLGAAAILASRVHRNVVLHPILARVAIRGLQLRKAARQVAPHVCNFWTWVVLVVLAFVVVVAKVACLIQECFLNVTVGRGKCSLLSLQRVGCIKRLNMCRLTF